MGIRNLMKKMLSTGQASMVEKAEGLYTSGDLEGAVKCLEEAIQSREESGKSLAVMIERHQTYSEELHLKRLDGQRNIPSKAVFDTSNYSRIEGVLSSIDRGIKEAVYKGKTRTKAEGLYKEYQRPFQELRHRVQKEKHAEIVDRLKRLKPEEDADEFVTLAEELRRLNGRLPKELHGACKAAEERSYVLPDDFQEFGNFTIERRLGSGGFASVFLASSKGIGHQSAIKIFSPQPTLVRESGLSLGELKDRFKREARIMLRLSEESIPGVVNARHSDFHMGKPYLLMDYYPRNLSDLIGADEDLLQRGKGKSLSYNEALPIIQSILTSINGLHNRPAPIIHRDLKPTNILLDQDNQPYIGDFGLARETSRIDLLSSAFQTSTGANLASQFYGAPEQRGGFKEADQRADIYSLGVMIYRILTGRLMGFHDLEPLEYYLRDLEADTADRLNNLLSKATRVDPNQRLSDVSTFLELFSTDPTEVHVGETLFAGPSAFEQYRMALEWAYTFAPEGDLPENVRTALDAKVRELGIDAAEAKVLEKDFRGRLGIGESGKKRVVSATSGSASPSDTEKGAGELSITSEPELADVFVDGIERGKTPITLSRIGGGKRSIRLKLDGYFPVRRIERIIPNQETKIDVIFEPQLGSIRAEPETFSKDYPAHFYLDGNLMGKTPLVVEDISAGVHAYRFEAGGHPSESGEVTVALDEETKISKKLEPLMGRISIKSIPPGAAIRLNSKHTEKKTNCKLKLQPGNYRLLLNLPGYVDAEKEVRLLPGDTLEETFTLVRNVSRLSVSSVPEGAAIWLDNRDTGEKTDAVLDVAPGKHVVVLQCDGYRNAKREVELTPDKFQEEEFRLKKGKAADASVPDESSAQSRYVAKGNGIVRDTQTGLEWRAGPDENTTWSEAKDWVDKLKSDSLTWRMPSIGELEALYTPGLGSQNITPLIKITGWRVWSREISPTREKARSFYLLSGQTTNEKYSKSHNGRALAVRLGGMFGFKQVEKGAGDRFLTSADNIFHDCETGLQWFVGLDKGTKFKEAKNWAESLKIGRGNWRMPTIAELMTIYENGLVPRNMAPFVETTGRMVWTSGIEGSRKAHAFSFVDGAKACYTLPIEPNRFRAFAVRSLLKKGKAADASVPDESSAQSRYVATDIGTVKDTKTSLEWVAGPNKDTTWKEAKSWVAGLRIDGRGWKMPTMDELESIYEKGVGDRNMTPLLKTTGWGVWSGETERRPSRAWPFNFSNGHRLLERRSHSHNKRAFAVRVNIYNEEVSSILPRYS